MAQRVSYRVDQEINKTVVEIKDRNGASYQQTVTSIPGDPNNSVPQADVEAKFRDCASFAFKPISPADIERVIQLVANLENEADATEIMRALS